MNNQLLDRVNNESLTVWSRFQKLYPRLKTRNQPGIVLSNRMTATAGNCIVEEGVITLAAKFLAKYPDTMLKVTLPHEYAHQVDFWLNGLPKRWHGASWKAIMINYGLPPDIYHSMKL